MKEKETNKDRMIKMDKVLCYLKEHIAEDVRAEQVAREFNYTTKYFEKLFKQYFNIPFPKYWTKLKMRYIASKLITKELILGKGMVSETGYANSAGFSKAFKKEFGISPTDFLKQNKEVPDMPIRCELFGVKIDFEYIMSSLFTITGNPIPIKDQDFSDAAEYIIEKAAWGLEKCNMDIEEEVYGLLWHDEKIDYGMIYVLGGKGNTGKITITIPEIYYAVFSCKRPDTNEETVELSRLLMRYIYNEWRVANDKKQNQRGIVYQKFNKDKISIYFPILRQAEEMKEDKKYGIENWTKYIDEHILEDLTIKQLAKLAHYSEKSFREIFELYYGMSPLEYISRRRSYMAATKLKEEPVQFEAINLVQYYDTYKKSLKISFKVMDEIKVLAKMILTREEDFNIPESASFYYRNDFDCIQGTRYACQDFSKGNKASLWDEVVDETTKERRYEYVLGPVVEEVDEIPEGMKVFTLAGGNYAIFYTENESDMESFSETFRMMTRCAFLGWIRENMVRMDWKRITFVRYYHGKMYFFVPILG